MDPLLIGMRFCHFLAVMILFGSSLFPLYALKKDGYGTRLVGFLQKVALGASLFALLSAIGWLGCEAVLMSGQSTGYRDWSILLTVLDETLFGRIWRWRLALMGIMTGFIVWREWNKSAPWILLMVAYGTVLVISLAGVGHGAMGSGVDEWVHLGNQGLHLISVSLWVGGLLSLMYLANEAKNKYFEIDILSCALRRFSTIGFLAVFLILASGMINSWFLVGSVDGLWQTTYGHVLVVKLAFFFCMVTLALLNRFLLMPQLSNTASAEKALRLLRSSITAEFVFAILVIVCVSVLGLLPPPFDMPAMTM